MAEKSHLSTEEKFTQLKEAKQRLQTPKRDHQNPPRQIQRVAHYLRDRERFAKNYSPKLVSIGPIHHGENNLQPGEEYKLMWTAMYVESTEQAQTLHRKIADKMQELKNLFSKDAIGGYDNEELSWMLFVDGCSLLQILENGDLEHPEELNIKVDQLVLVMQDVYLLESQLPYQALKLLLRDDNEAKLMETMEKFLHCHHLSPVGAESASKLDVVKRKHKDQDIQDSSEDHEPRESKQLVQEESRSPTHLLDLLHTTVLRDLNHREKADNVNQNQDATKENNMITYGNIKDLKASGIRVKSSKSRRLRISFSRGWFAAELKLPEIIVDDTTATTFLNLMAYEMCPDFENDYGICSFVVFLDSLIDHPDDVKELRSAKVLYNALGSDEEVAKLFNTLSIDLVPDAERYAHIRDQIEKHYTNNCNTWIARAYHTYFSNPWAIIAFLAALIALVLAFIQTWFAIHPPTQLASSSLTILLHDFFLGKICKQFVKLLSIGKVR